MLAGSSHIQAELWAGSRSSDSEFWILLDLGDVGSVPGHHRENHWEYAGSSRGDLADSGFWILTSVTHYGSLLVHYMALSINYELITRRLRGLNQLYVKIQNPES